jgi:hypothetical protein
MCGKHILLVVCLAFFLSLSVSAQQTASSSPQALALLQNSLAALTGGQPISDITLSGTARRIAGSDDESGPAMYRAIPTANRLDLTLSGGARTEIFNFTTPPPAGSWSGPDGVSHPLAPHNLMNQASAIPAFTLAALTPAQNFVLLLVGQEVKNGHSVYHLSASQQYPQMSGNTASLAQHLAQMDVFLDASTYLPVALDFSIHPDNDAGLDIPVELLFSNYQAVSGVRLPFHVQKFLNNSLLLDLQFTSAQLNTGLPPSLFNVQ